MNYLLRKDLHKSELWKTCRDIILSSMGKVCLKCGCLDNIEIDHIKPKSRFPRKTFDIYNLQPLCSECNTVKSNTSYTDYRSDQNKEGLDWFVKGNSIDVVGIRDNNKIDAVVLSAPKSKSGSLKVRINPDLSYGQNLSASKVTRITDKQDNQAKLSKLKAVRNKRGKPLKITKKNKSKTRRKSFMQKVVDDHIVELEVSLAKTSREEFLEECLNMKFDISGKRID